LLKQSQHKDLPHAGSQITQTIAAISAAGLVIASAGFGSVFAYTVGVQHGPLLAGLTIVMAIALELAKPLAVSGAFAAFRSWAIIRGVALSILAAVAIAYSLTAELQLVASSRGDLVAKREDAIEQRDDRRESIKAARAELALLAPSRTVEEAKGDIAKLLAANPQAGNCRSMDNATTRYVCPKVAALNGEAARAKRRGELQARIDKAAGSAPSTGTVKNADPGSAALATFLATLGVAVSAARVSDWLTIVPVAALELGAALSLLLVQSVSGGAPTGHASEQKSVVSGQGAEVQPNSATVADRNGRVSPGGPAPKQTKKRTRGKAGSGERPISAFSSPVRPMRAEDALHKIEQAFRDANNALRNATSSPKNSHPLAACVVSEDIAHLIHSLILRRQQDLPRTSRLAGATLPELRGLGFDFTAVGSQTFAHKPNARRPEWVCRLAQLGMLLLSPPKAEYSDFAWGAYSHAHNLAPQAAFDMKLVLVALGMLIHWPDIRPEQAKLRIRHQSSGH
jgi:hypothetical protein